MFWGSKGEYVCNLEVSSCETPIREILTQSRALDLGTLRTIDLRNINRDFRCQENRGEDPPKIVKGGSSI